MFDPDMNSKIKPEGPVRMTDIPTPEEWERYLTIEQVADLYGVVTRTVRNWIDSGDLEAFKRDRLYRISPSAIQRFYKKNIAKPRRRYQGKKKVVGKQ